MLRYVQGFFWVWILLQTRVFQPLFLQDIPYSTLPHERQKLTSQQHAPKAGYRVWGLIVIPNPNLFLRLGVHLLLLDCIRLLVFFLSLFLPRIEVSSVTRIPYIAHRS